MSTEYTFEISASTVAWYGAIVATAGALISIYNVLRDRPRIKMQFQKDMNIYGHQSVYPKDKTYISITVINKGRRPVNITKAGLRTLGAERKYAMFNDSFSAHRNRVLTEESPTSEFMVEQDEKILELLSGAWYIWTQDATGKMYRKYLHSFPYIWRAVYWIKNRK